MLPRFPHSLAYATRDVRQIVWFYIVLLLAFFWRSNMGSGALAAITPDLALPTADYDKGIAVFFICFIVWSECRAEHWPTSVSELAPGRGTDDDFLPSSIHFFLHLSHCCLFLISYLTPDSHLNLRTSTSLLSLALTLAPLGRSWTAIPSLIIQERFIKARYWISFNTLILGGAQIGMGWVTNAGHIWAVRFFLGIGEAGILGGLILLMMHWYTVHQTAFRVVGCFPANSVDEKTADEGYERTQSAFFGLAALIGSMSGILAFLLNLVLNNASGRYGWVSFFLSSFCVVSPS